MSSIKVNRIKLIAELKAARERILDEAKDVAKAWEDYDKAVEAWVVKVVKQAKPSQARTHYSNDVVITPPSSLPKPKEPAGRRPTEKTWYYDFGKRGDFTTLTDISRRKVDEIDNTLKLLSLSNEENVSATAYKSVSQYL